jgi:hypothetical protein
MVNSTAAGGSGCWSKSSGSRGNQSYRERDGLWLWWGHNQEMVCATKGPGRKIKTFAEGTASPRYRGTDLFQAPYPGALTKGPGLDGIAHASSANSALASTRSGVSKPSVNQL